MPNTAPPCSTARAAAWRRDDPKALHWLRAAADQKQPEAEYLLAVVYRFGWLGAGRNPKQSLLLLQRSALQGHAPAQFDLGLAYIDGQIVKPDPQEALGMADARRAPGPRPGDRVRRPYSGPAQERKSPIACARRASSGSHSSSLAWRHSRADGYHGSCSPSSR